MTYQPPKPSSSGEEFLKVLGVLGMAALGGMALGRLLSSSDDDEGGTTHNYMLEHQGRTVYHGITDRLEARVVEHARSGKVFDTMWFEDPRHREEARQLERERLAQHRDSNRGKNPKYNKKRDG